VSGVAELRCIEWSPTNDTLALSAITEERPGIWVVDPDRRSVKLLSELEADCIGWSPDGTKLAAVTHVGVLEDLSTVFVLQVPPSLRG
jgi:Tol biopolymer transport system component